MSLPWYILPLAENRFQAAAFHSSRTNTSDTTTRDFPNAWHTSPPQSSHQGVRAAAEALVLSATFERALLRRED